ncbi:heme biosynthesis protein HemY [Pinisolibacter sp.]|uniref:heme biosynthesis protein HemY n=1 Tax=Pinisolibacter sp. TaxID=2172024 RepID=UPI002FDE5FA4
MIRLLFFFAALVALAFGFAWLADRPGEVTFAWQGYRIETDVMTAAIGALVALVAVIFILALLRGIWNTPGAIGSFFGRRRREKGWTALSRGMIAVGAGDLGGAIKASGEARQILGNEPLALLLEAQSAQLIGDRSGAKKAFERMLETPATRLLGMRGLYVEAVRWGDGEAAARYAASANTAAPKLAWAAHALVEYRSQACDWMGALETIDRNRRNGIVDKPTAKRLRAVVLTGDGLEREQGHPDVVRGNALEAHGLAPDLVPAACLAARLLGRAGDLKKAAKVLEATWKLDPHPEIAETYAHLRAGDSAKDRLTRIRDLIKVRAHHPECALALARAEIDAHEFDAARKTLEPFLVQAPSKRVCLLMAELEQNEHGGAGATRAWLARAVSAPRDKAWVADGWVSDHWMPVSPISGKLDAFEWKLPPEDVTTAPLADLFDEPTETLTASGSVVPLEAPKAAREAIAAKAETIEAEVIEPEKPAVAPAPAPTPAAKPEAKAAEAKPIEASAPAVEAKPVVVEAKPVEVPPAAPVAEPAPAVPIEAATVVTTPVEVASSQDPEIPPPPDDPGTDDVAPAPKKRFKLFG